MPEKNGCLHEEAPPNSAALEVCWLRSFLEGSWWDLRGAPWSLPPASAGWNWGSDPASAPLSAWARGSHCRLPWDTCLDQLCLPQADGTRSLVSKCYSIYLVILWRECSLKTSPCKYNAMLVMWDHQRMSVFICWRAWLGPAEWFRGIPNTISTNISNKVHMCIQSKDSWRNRRTQIKSPY